MKWLSLLLLSFVLTGCTQDGGFNFNVGASQSGLPQWRATSTDPIGGDIGNAVIPRTNQRVYINDSATTTGSLTLTDYQSCNLDTDSNGLLVCGTDADSGGGGGSGNVSTSTAEVTGELAVWSSTGATPATLASYSDLFFQSGLAKLFATNLASTNATTTNSTTTARLVIDSGGIFTFDGQQLDSLTDDATLSNNSGDLQVVDVTCTDCINATEIEDIYVLTAGDTMTGALQIESNASSTGYLVLGTGLGTITPNAGDFFVSGNATTTNLTTGIIRLDRVDDEARIYYDKDGEDSIIFNSLSDKLSFLTFSGNFAHLNFGNIATSNKTFTWPNITGTVALNTSANNFTGYNDFAGGLFADNASTTNATSSKLVLGITNYPTLNLQDGDLWARAATTTNLTITTANQFYVGSDLFSEAVADLAGAMVTGNTESGITVAYQDADNTVDYTVAAGVANLTSSDFGDWTCNGSACTVDANAIALATDTTGDYCAAITGGTGIASTGATSGENISHTLSFDATEIDAVTWSDGANASNLWTMNLSGTDPTLLWGSASGLFTGNWGVAGTASSTSGISVNGLFTVNGTGNSTTTGSIVGGNDGGTATTTITIGTTSMTNNGGCLIIRDTDGAGFTYCSALNGTLSCSATDICS